MGLANIVDRRGNEYSAARLNVVMEPSFHDNSISGADQYSEAADGPIVESRKYLSLAEAIAWANDYADPVTLFLYDADDDPIAVRRLPGPDSLPSLQQCKIAIDALLEREFVAMDRRLIRLLNQSKTKIDWLVDFLSGKR